MEPVRTRRSRQVVEAHRLHRVRDRRKAGVTLLEGPHLLEEALNAKATVIRVFARPDDQDSAVLCEKNGIEHIPVDDAALKRLTDTSTPRGPVAVVEIPKADRPLSGNTVVSWGVSDPGNVGTIIRTAAAFGWGFAYTEGTADPWSPRVLRAGAGNQFHLSITQITGLGDINAAKLPTVASVVGGGVTPDDITERPLALLIGEEAPGLPVNVVANADYRVTIPMSGGVESLNASVAAAILMHDLGKHSGQGDTPV